MVNQRLPLLYRWFVFGQGRRISPTSTGAVLVSRVYTDMIIPKISVDVELRFHDGELALGQVFIRANQRVLDMLNGEISFFPFRQADGQLVLINKKYVVSVLPFDQRG